MVGKLCNQIGGKDTRNIVHENNPNTIFVRKVCKNKIDRIKFGQLDNNLLYLCDARKQRNANQL